MRKRLVGLLSIALLAGAGSARATSGPETDGLRAYVAGRFDEAAVGLKQSVRAGAGDGAKRTGSAVSGRTAYFLARSFEELGLRGLALHYLGQAELYGSPEWQLLARRELARAYFEVTDYPAVMEVVDRMKGQPADAEICYFAGLAAAELRAWPEAIEMLGRVPAASAYASYAVYARAQAKAASGDFAGALADLDRVISRVERDPAGVRRISFAFWKSAEHPDALLEQARVLRGKILYVDGRDGEARSSFAAVGGGGGSGLEAMRGLLLTGAGMESAAKVEVSPSRPVDATALMTVQALAAEEREDDDTARRIRSRVQSMVRDRLFVLEGSQGAAERSLEQDVSAFWSRLRRARWSQRWQDEADALGDVAGSLGRPAAAPSDPFRPQDGLFYGVWD
jgi:hypothetical protein